MTDSLAVAVQNVSKMYRLFDSPQQRLWEALHPLRRKYHREFWALRDINFEVPQGTTLGIIGRNGSGKSTLLQIICSVLSPTKGAVEVNGRISALLELGAGFNPEFTGSANAIFYGMLMGYSKKEMAERLPDIEAFAEIGEYFYQPVKTYSSGMFVRLAFSAAINVDPDILVIDEALAVGDAKFQRKCFRKFIEFQEAGKTIIFVTHDLYAITKYCDKAILIEKGKAILNDQPKNVVNAYHDLLLSGELSSSDFQPLPLVSNSSNYSISAVLNGFYSKPPQRVEQFLQDIPIAGHYVTRKNYNKNEYRFGDRRAEILDYLVMSNGIYDPINVQTGQWLDIYIKVGFHHPIAELRLGFLIKTVDGIPIYGTNTQYARQIVEPVRFPGIKVYKWSVKMEVAPGDIFLDLGIDEAKGIDIITLDKRCDFIHLIAETEEQFTGFSKLDMTFEEIVSSPDRL